jgi:hypothetical protein
MVKAIAPKNPIQVELQVTYNIIKPIPQAPDYVVCKCFNIAILSRCSVFAFAKGDLTAIETGEGEIAGDMVGVPVKGDGEEQVDEVP